MQKNNNNFRPVSKYKKSEYFYLRKSSVPKLLKKVIDLRARLNYEYLEIVSYNEYGIIGEIEDALKFAKEAPKKIIKKPIIINRWLIRPFKYFFGMLYANSSKYFRHYSKSRNRLESVPFYNVPQNRARRLRKAWFERYYNKLKKKFSLLKLNRFMRKFPLSKPTKFRLSSTDFKKFAFRNKYRNKKLLKKIYFRTKRKKNKIRRKKKKFLILKKTRLNLFKYYYIFFKQQFWVATFFSAFNKNGKKKLAINYYLNIIIFLKKKYNKSSTFLVPLYFNQVIVNLVPMFGYKLVLKRRIKYRYPYLAGKDFSTQRFRQLKSLSIRWIKKAVLDSRRTELTLFLRIWSVLQETRANVGYASSFRKRYYKFLCKNRSYVKLHWLGRWI